MPHGTIPECWLCSCCPDCTFKDTALDCPTLCWTDINGIWCLIVSDWTNIIQRFRFALWCPFFALLSCRSLKCFCILHIKKKIKYDNAPIIFCLFAVFHREQDVMSRHLPFLLNVLISYYTEIYNSRNIEGIFAHRLWISLFWALILPVILEASVN